VALFLFAFRYKKDKKRQDREERSAHNYKQDFNSLNSVNSAGAETSALVQRLLGSDDEDDDIDIEVSSFDFDRFVAEERSKVTEARVLATKQMEDAEARSAKRLADATSRISVQAKRKAAGQAKARAAAAASTAQAAAAYANSIAEETAIEVTCEFDAESGFALNAPARAYCAARWRQELRRMSDSSGDAGNDPLVRVDFSVLKEATNAFDERRHLLAVGVVAAAVCLKLTCTASLLLSKSSTKQEASGTINRSRRKLTICVASATHISTSSWQCRSTVLSGASSSST
jgi:hypothetical protein